MCQLGQQKKPSSLLYAKLPFAVKTIINDGAFIFSISIKLDNAFINNTSMPLVGLPYFYWWVWLRFFYYVSINIKKCA